MNRSKQRLRDVMCPILVVDLDESVRSAAEQMVRSNLTAIAVAESGRIVGVLSCHRLIEKVIAECRLPDVTTVSMIMDSSPVRISDDRDVETALLVMQAREAHELLVQDLCGHVVGIFCDCKAANWR